MLLQSKEYAKVKGCIPKLFATTIEEKKICKELTRFGLQKIKKSYETNYKDEIVISFDKLLKAIQMLLIPVSKGIKLAICSLNR